MSENRQPNILFVIIFLAFALCSCSKQVRLDELRLYQYLGYEYTPKKIIFDYCAPTNKPIKGIEDYTVRKYTTTRDYQEIIRTNYDDKFIILGIAELKNYLMVETHNNNFFLIPSKMLNEYNGDDQMLYNSPFCYVLSYSLLDNPISENLIYENELFQKYSSLNGGYKAIKCDSKYYNYVGKHDRKKFIIYLLRIGEYNQIGYYQTFVDSSTKKHFIKGMPDEQYIRLAHPIKD